MYNHDQVILKTKEEKKETCLKIIKEKETKKHTQRNEFCIVRVQEPLESLLCSSKHSPIFLKYALMPKSQLSVIHETRN